MIDPCYAPNLLAWPINLVSASCIDVRCFKTLVGHWTGKLYITVQTPYNPGSAVNLFAWAVCAKK